MSINWTVVILAALVVYLLLDLRRWKRRVQQLEKKLAEPVGVEIETTIVDHDRRLQTLETSDRKRTLLEMLR